MENQKDGKETAKRTTPGRTAKNNKRKLSEEKPSRAVKAKSDAADMSISLEQLQAKLAKSEERTAAKIDKTIQGGVC